MSEINERKLLHFFEEDALGIFQKRCKYEEMNMIFTRTDPAEMEERLLNIVDQCKSLKEENSKVTLNYIYQLLQAIQVGMRVQRRENQTRYANIQNMGMKVYQEVMEFAFKNFSQTEIALVFQRLLTSNTHYEVNINFQNFLVQLFQ